MKILQFLFSYPWYARLSTILYYKWRMQSCGVKVLIYKPLFITPESIAVGDRVYISKNCRIEGVSQYAGKFFSPAISIGNGVSVQQNLHLTCASHISIGNNTAIGANVTITDIHHSYTDIEIPIENQDIQVNSVAIGADCKIYNNSVILPGTHIGKHCTIGANSVVCGIIPDYSVVVGVPAKVVKCYNFITKQWERR